MVVDRVSSECYLYIIYVLKVRVVSKLRILELIKQLVCGFETENLFSLFCFKTGTVV